MLSQRLLCRDPQTRSHNPGIQERCHDTHGPVYHGNHTGDNVPEEQPPAVTPGGGTDVGLILQPRGRLTGPYCGQSQRLRLPT